MPYIDIVYQTDPATGQLLFDADGYPLQDAVANAGAATYGRLQERVANEVLGAITTTDVQEAIQDAIEYFSSEDLYFNSIRYFGNLSGSSSQLVTVAGKEFYSYPDLHILANMPHIMKGMIFAFNNRFPLICRTPQWIDDQSISPTWQGLPTDFATYPNGMLRLYPIPNQAYQVILEGTIRLPPLSDDADFNVWTNRGANLIRYDAKRRLFTDLTRDEGQANKMAEQIYGIPNIRQGELGRLRRETMRRAGGPGKLRPSRGYMS